MLLLAFVCLWVGFAGGLVCAAFMRSNDTSARRDFARVASLQQQQVRGDDREGTTPAG